MTLLHSLSVVRRPLVIAVSAVAIVVCGVLAEAVIAGRQVRSVSRSVEKSESSLAARRAHGLEGLRAASAVDGSFVVEEFHTPKGAPQDLLELMAITDVVVVARVGNNVCRLSVDESTITTRYTMTVESVLLGHAGSVDSIGVNFPGGRVAFEDGAFAQVNTPGFLKPNMGDRLLLFLNRSADGDFIPVSGPLGVYNLSQTIRPFMMPSGGYRTTLSQRLVAEKLTAEGLLLKVQGLTRTPRI